jgi:hypothetical protein
MPNGDPLQNGATFSSFRSQYQNVPKYMEYKKAYDDNNLASLGTSAADMKKKQEAMESVELTLHRFWHAGDYLLALGTMAELYPDLQADKYGEEDPEPSLKVDESIEVEVGSTNKITSNVTGSTFESADKSVATVTPDGTVTGVKEGTTTVTVTTPNGQKATVTVTVTPTESTTAPTDNQGDTIATGVIDPSTCLYGDVDLNGEVALSDVIRLSKYLVNNTLYPVGNNTEESIAKAIEQANVAYDNKIDSVDNSKLIEFNTGALPQSALGPQK